MPAIEDVLDGRKADDKKDHKQTNGQTDRQALAFAHSKMFAFRTYAAVAVIASVLMQQMLEKKKRKQQQQELELFGAMDKGSWLSESDK